MYEITFRKPQLRINTDRWRTYTAPTQRKL